MNLNLDELREFLHKYEGQTVFLFGFTFMIWQYFYKKLKEMKVYLPIEMVYWFMEVDGRN